jgi:hypothetical protein
LLVRSCLQLDKVACLTGRPTAAAGKATIKLSKKTYSSRGHCARAWPPGTSDETSATASIYTQDDLRVWIIHGLTDQSSHC